MLQQLAPARAGSDRAAPDGAPVSGAYKVDISRGERIGRVSSEWFSRPDDERYLSLGSSTRRSARRPRHRPHRRDQGAARRGEPFQPSQLAPGEPLQLYAHEVAWGMFDELEKWRRQHHVPYIRRSGGYCSEWGAERAVFDGADEPRSYDADESDRIFVDRATALRLGSVEAILAHCDTAEFTLPPLAVAGEP